MVIKMRLFKFLLIADEIINNPNLFIEQVFSKRYNHHKTSEGLTRDVEVLAEYKNKFYINKLGENIVFMGSGPMAVKK